MSLNRPVGSSYGMGRLQDLLNSLRMTREWICHLRHLWVADTEWVVYWTCRTHKKACE